MSYKEIYDTHTPVPNDTTVNGLCALVCSGVGHGLLREYIGQVKVGGVVAGCVLFLSSTAFIGKYEEF